MKGTVKWWDPKKGFGFIARETGQDVFVHHTAVLDADKNLREGEVVSFDVIETEKGFKAVNVKREQP